MSKERIMSVTELQSQELDAQAQLLELKAEGTQTPIVKTYLKAQAGLLQHKKGTLIKTTNTRQPHD